MSAVPWLNQHFGADANMVDLRLNLAAGCPKITANQIMDLCGVDYPASGLMKGNVRPQVGGEWLELKASQRLHC